MSRYRRRRRASGGIGCLACLLIGVVYFWPFAVLHGTAAVAVGVPWLIATIGMTLAAAGRAQAVRSRQPLKLAGETRHREPLSYEVKRAVWVRDRGMCRHCGIGEGESMRRHGEHLQYDHVIPFSRNGADTVANLQLLCGPCNRAKSNFYSG